LAKLNCFTERRETKRNGKERGREGERERDLEPNKTTANKRGPLTIYSLYALPNVE
jgi:hypothetical protein